MHRNVLEEFENYVKNTGNERRVKKRKLNDLNSNMVKQKKINSFLSDHRPNESKQKQFDNNVLNYIICSMKLLSTVEDENFIKIINGMYYI